MKSFLKLIVAILAGALCFWLGAKLLPLVAPFLCSLVGAALAEPAVAALYRRGVRRNIAVGLVCTMGLVVLWAAAWGLSVGSFYLLGSYAKQAPPLLAALTETAQEVRTQVQLVLKNLPDSVAQEFSLAADGVAAKLSEAPLWLSEQAFQRLTLLAKHSPNWLLFVCTAIIGTYFFSAYWEDLKGFFRRQLPESVLQKLALLRRVTFGAVWGYLKVQCILSGVTFLVLVGAFSLMGIETRFTAAAGIAIIDALPILGSGAVLLPWALIALICGNIPRALAVLLIYAVLTVLHNLLQAKLMGKQLGLHPITALVSLYAGWKLAGLAGMLLLPIGCVLLTGLHDAGIVRIYQ